MPCPGPAKKLSTRISRRIERFRSGRICLWLVRIGRAAEVVVHTLSSLEFLRWIIEKFVS